jgi:hypothetical protein
VATLRRSIADAMIRGDVPQLAADYLALASSFARARRFADAEHELEEGIDLMSGGRGPSAPGEPVARLVVALASLFDEAGERERARRIAACADRQPTLADVTR